jgi:hypothetical protein
MKALEEMSLAEMRKDEFKALLKELLIELLIEKKIGVKNEDSLINVQEAAALLNLAVQPFTRRLHKNLFLTISTAKKLCLKDLSS